ncbi:MAG TPA: protein tyrosine phosphatase family protein [Nevskiaceae bacterium]
MTEAIDVPGLINLKHPEPHCVCGGQPTPEQLAGAARTGVKCVISLRPPTENIGYDEGAQAKQLGLDYHVVPIAGAQDLNKESVAELDRIMSASSGGILVHCASGNRVGALMALRAAWIGGESTEAALETGRRWGLTKLEPVVRRLLA